MGNTTALTIRCLCLSPLPLDASIFPSSIPPSFAMCLSDGFGGSENGSCVSRLIAGYLFRDARRKSKRSFSGSRCRCRRAIMASAPENKPINHPPPFCHFVFRQRCCFRSVCWYFVACGSLPLCRGLFRLGGDERDSRPLALVLRLLCFNSYRRFSMFLLQVKQKQDKETRQQAEQETQRAAPRQSARLLGETPPLAARRRSLFLFCCFSAAASGEAPGGVLSASDFTAECFPFKGKQNSSY